MNKKAILILSLILTLSFVFGACDKSDSSTNPKSTTSETTAVTSSMPMTTGTTSAATMTGTTMSTVAITDPSTDETTAATTNTTPTTTNTTPTTSTAPTTTAASSASPTELPIADAGTNHLTGLPLTDPTRAKVRPVAIMISNIKIATPQIGIRSADLYYEMVVEGGITRMMVVFADPKKVPELGSIRSARTDYIDYAGGLDAILVHFGASSHANDQINRLKTAHIDLMNAPAAYWRDPVWARVRGAEHSVKTTGKRLAAAIENQGLRSTRSEPLRSAFSFQPAGKAQPAAGSSASPASSVSVVFSNYITAVFRYDAKTGIYTKSQFGKPQLDLADNKPLTVTNILVVRTEIKQVMPGVKWMDADLSAGSGYYVSRGTRIPIKWHKGAVSDPFTFTLEDGSPLLINRGKTYICVQDSDNSLKFS